MTISRISEQINGNGRPARLDDATLEAYGKYTLPQILSEQAKRLGTAHTAIREKASAMMSRGGSLTAPPVRWGQTPPRPACAPAGPQQ